MKIELNKSHEVEKQEDGAYTISLDEQTLEHSRRKEKIERIRKEVGINSECDIIEDEGEFYAVDTYGEKWYLSVEFRNKLPNSYFHSPEFDGEILGYEHKTGAIIYDLWKMGKTEMMISERIYSDFHDTGYGIGKILSFIEKNGFGDKIPPIHILQSDFLNYHQTLQGSLYAWGYDNVSLVNDIGVREHKRLDLINSIESGKKSFEEFGNKWSEEMLNSHHNEMERLEKEYQEFVEADESDLSF
ncbi:MAG: hypothetical protein ABR974_05055 [Bacteroidales bacterium]|jgi:hypothetical protein